MNLFYLSLWHSIRSKRLDIPWCQPRAGLLWFVEPHLAIWHTEAARVKDSLQFIRELKTIYRNGLLVLLNRLLFIYILFYFEIVISVIYFLRRRQRWRGWGRSPPPQKWPGPRRSICRQHASFWWSLRNRSSKKIHSVHDIDKCFTFLLLHLFTLHVHSLTRKLRDIRKGYLPIFHGRGSKNMQVSFHLLINASKLQVTRTST